MTDTPFLLCDLETSGLRPGRAVLLEVGFALVSPDLEIVERASWVAPYGPPTLRTIRDDASPVVQDMHDGSGLWEACATAEGEPRLTHLSAMEAVYSQGSWRSEWPAHREILDWVATHAADPDIPLTGSSVHFDARWLEAWFPEVLEGRTHRLPDPSGLREMLDRWGPRGPQIVASRPPARKVHRVDPDLDDTLAEMAYYRDALGLGPNRLGITWAGPGAVPATVTHPLVFPNTAAAQPWQPWRTTP
jgi:oligoribonuclease (3'-5' exoribonuclease)